MRSAACAIWTRTSRNPGCRAFGCSQSRPGRAGGHWGHSGPCSCRVHTPAPPTGPRVCNELSWPALRRLMTGGYAVAQGCVWAPTNASAPGSARGGWAPSSSARSPRAQLRGVHHIDAAPSPLAGLGAGHIRCQHIGRAVQVSARRPRVRRAAALCAECGDVPASHSGGAPRPCRSSGCTPGPPLQPAVEGGVPLRGARGWAATGQAAARTAPRTSVQASWSTASSCAR